MMISIAPIRLYVTRLRDIARCVALQAKAFLGANPKLASKLQTAIAEGLASGADHSKGSDSVTGDIPTDSPGLLTVTEQEQSEAGGTGAEGAGGMSVLSVETSHAEAGGQGDVESSEEEGRVARDRYSVHGGVLLEPGVKSEAELMMPPPDRVTPPKSEGIGEGTEVRA